MLTTTISSIVVFNSIIYRLLSIDTTILRLILLLDFLLRACNSRTAFNPHFGC